MFETSPDLPAFSPDQDAAWEKIAKALAAHGVDLATGETEAREDEQAAHVLAVLGKAGSGKTVLLAALARRLKEMKLLAVQNDWEPRKSPGKRSFAILAPTNKAASVLRNKRVSATTIHRIIYTPVYDPEFEQVAEWLEGTRSTRPETDAMSAEAMDRAANAYGEHGSVAGALAAAGVRGADFITGWKRREAPLDIALVDEASMLDSRQLDDLKAIFGLIVLFGDPAQLAPVGEGGEMVFEALAEPSRLSLSRIHRQAADNPILDLAHMLGDPDVGFDDFAQAVAEAAEHDERVLVAPRVDADLMRESPVLVWRNKTRIRLIAGFRAAHEIPEGALIPGEPLVCDGLELPMKQRKQRVELEARGLVKGAQATYLGPGKKAAYQRVNIAGIDEPGVSVAAIVQIEQPDNAEPILASAARMGAVFLHGAAVTIHKAQGSQWPSVQVFGPDLSAAAWAGQEEAGLPLWKRLAYVAITRAEDRLIWITRSMIARPTQPLGQRGADELRPG
ncbi:MAG: AAA family ATPase [Pseudomonadota bacterium]